MSLKHPLDGKPLNYFSSLISTGDERYDAITSEVLFPSDSTGETLKQLIAENNVNEYENNGGQRNFGENYKEQELYYASEQYKKTLEPYQKSSSGNKVNSDQASNNAAIANKLTE